MSDKQIIERSLTPIKLKQVDVSGVQPGTGGLHAMAGAVRLNLPGPDGKPVLTEFFIGGRTREDVQRAVESFGAWTGGPLAEEAVRPVVLISEDCAIFDDEL